jgi:hypothetical protein
VELLTAAEVKLSIEVAACEVVVLARGPILSMETGGRREDSLNPAVRVACARAPSVASGMADRQGTFLFAEGPASVAEDFMAAVDFTAVEDFMVAGVGNRSFVVFPVDRNL